MPNFIFKFKTSLILAKGKNDISSILVELPSKVKEND